MDKKKVYIIVAIVVAILVVLYIAMCVVKPKAQYSPGVGLRTKPDDSASPSMIFCGEGTCCPKAYKSGGCTNQTQCRNEKGDNCYGAGTGRTACEGEDYLGCKEVGVGICQWYCVDVKQQ